jgi:hypothetical protein
MDLWRYAIKPKDIGAGQMIDTFLPLCPGFVALSSQQASFMGGPTTSLIGHCQRAAEVVQKDSKMMNMTPTADVDVKWLLFGFEPTAHLRHATDWRRRGAATAEFGH